MTELKSKIYLLIFLILTILGVIISSLLFVKLNETRIKLIESNNELTTANKSLDDFNKELEDANRRIKMTNDSLILAERRIQIINDSLLSVLKIIKRNGYRLNSDNKFAEIIDDLLIKSEQTSLSDLARIFNLKIFVEEGSGLESFSLLLKRKLDNLGYLNVVRERPVKEVRGKSNYTIILSNEFEAMIIEELEKDLKVSFPEISFSVQREIGDRYDNSPDYIPIMLKK